MDRGAWWAIVQGVSKSCTWLSDQVRGRTHTHTYTHTHQCCTMYIPGILDLRPCPLHTWIRARAELTTMKYHLTLVRMAINQKVYKRWMLERLWRKKRTLLYCWWECKLVEQLQKTVWRLLKKLRVAIWFSNPTSGHISTKNCNSKRYMHSNLHTSTIYNNRDIKTK